MNAPFSMANYAAAQQQLEDALDEWDADWRDHYGTIDSAEANYHRAMAADSAARLAGIDR